MRRRLVEEAPKVGNADDQADEMLHLLFDAFASACEQYGRTGRGGILRPGTGSAMYYLWLAQGHAGMREPVVESHCRRAQARRSLQRQPGPLARRAGGRPDQRPAILQPYRLPAGGQRRPGHARAVGYGLPQSRSVG